MMTHKDIWEWRPSGPACEEKHVWVYYHSKRIRECCECGAREGLWADFGLGGDHGTTTAQTEATA
jgi:hypothetical protein